MADNEGPTQTLALLPGSPAVNAGDPAITGGGQTDQRDSGFPRVQQVVLDIGAFEFYDGPQSTFFKVTTLDDHNDGVCGALDCTLAEAIVAANLRNASQTRITFKPGLNGTINLKGPLPEVTANMDIEGPGAGLITVRRNTGGNYPVFVQNTPGLGILSLFNLTISNGVASGGSGGGVQIISGQLYIEGCTLSGNSATNGGAIGPRTWEVYKCVFTGNTATNNGGALYNDGNGLLVRLTNSVVSGNTADNVGGGIANSNDGTLYVYNCEISGNTGVFGGGGFYNNGDAIVNDSTLDGNQTTPDFGGAGGGIGNDVGGTIAVQSATITGNSADSGGGIWNHNTGTLTLENSIVALNAAKTIGPDIQGAAETSSKFNLVGNGTGMTGISHGTTGNLIGTGAAPIDPKIGPLADNGGTTKTRALLTDSPAINSGDPTFNTAQRDDQRGDGTIPSLFPRVMGGIVDRGAFEFYFSADSTRNFD